MGDRPGQNALPGTRCEQCVCVCSGADQCCFMCMDVKDGELKQDETCVCSVADRTTDGLTCARHLEHCVQSF